MPARASSCPSRPPTARIGNPPHGGVDHRTLRMTGINRARLAGTGSSQAHHLTAEQHRVRVGSAPPVIMAALHPCTTRLDITRWCRRRGGDCGQAFVGQFRASVFHQRRRGRRALLHRHESIKIDFELARFRNVSTLPVFAPVSISARWLWLTSAALARSRCVSPSFSR
jgi:hypothetical protein